MSLELKQMGEAGQLWSSAQRSQEVIQKSKNAREDSKLKEISQEFESLFVEMLLQSMRKAIPKSGLMDGGNAEDIYRGMLDSEYAKIIAKHGDAGLAAMVEKQLLELMGKRQLSVESAQLHQGRKAYGLPEK